jgi:uncharacterized protein (DUF885 family)
LIATVASVQVAGCAGSAPKPAESAAQQNEASPAADTAEQRLERELDAIWALNMKRYPTWATYEGVRKYDHLLSDPSSQAIEEHLSALEAIAERVEAIPPDELSPMSADTRRLVVQQVDQARQERVCLSERWNVNGLGGPQVDYAMIPVFHTVRNADDLANLEARYRAVPAQIDAIVANLEAGVESGHTPARINVEAALRQLDAALAVPVEKSPLLRVRYADGVEPMPLESLTDAVKTSVRPALERYRTTLKQTVLPAARTVPGVTSLTDGKACYQAKMIGHIGPGFTAEGLHEEGLKQLELAHDGMVRVGKELGLESDSARDVIDAITTNEANYAESEEQLLKLNNEVVERAKSAMPRAFGRLPETPVEVRAIEAHRAGDAPAAYYYSAPEDGSRPGIYYVNTDQPTTRPLFNLEALAFHEALPGHHLQIALASELPDVHVWRRSQGQTAFVEGWALYAEILADELDLYSSPLTLFGMYNYQAWRAARLVLDTGLHHMGWSRDKAIEFLAENTGLPRNEVENEVNRYIAWPGQALAYMVGRLTIEELRAEAERELGEKFSLVAFHDEVHRHGAVPLTLLRSHIRAWIDRETE